MQIDLSHQFSTGTPPNSSHDDLELLISLLKHIEGQLNRADTKAQFTLTINAFLIASMTVLGPKVTGNVLLDDSAAVVTRLSALFSIMMLILLLISTYQTLLAAIPNLTPTTHLPDNFFYFGSIIKNNMKKITDGEKDFIDRYSSRSTHEIRCMLLTEVYALSFIAYRKYKWIRLSHQLLFGAGVFWAVIQILAIFG